MDKATLKIYKKEQNQLEKWRTQSAKGDQAALYNMGVYYMYGYGVPQDETEGLRLIRQAAENGYPEAQNCMGDFYGNTPGEANYPQALEWWNKAAAQNEPYSQFKIGQCYEYGWNVPQSDTTAVYWYRLSAEQGVSDAQFALSNCYLEGKGVPVDNQEALFWILLSFPNGWNEGYPTIENVASKLTINKRKVVEANARKWLKSHKKRT